MKKEIITLIILRFIPNQYPTFADRLKLVMTLRGYSTQRLADRLFLSHSTVSCYRQGTRMPDATILVRICQELRVSTDFLLGFTDYIIEQQL